MVTQRFLFALLIMPAFLLTVFTYILPANPFVNVPMAVAALFIDITAFSTKLYMDFFVPFIKMKKRTLVVSDTEAYTLSPAGNTLIVRRGSDIFASAYVKIPAYRSASEMNDEEKVDFSRLFSRALTLTKNPVKYGAQLYVINKDAYINNIKDRLDEAEEKYQNVLSSKNAPKGESDRIRGEVTMWHNLYESVNRVRSQALEAFAMVTAEGRTEEEASNLALQQADELATGVSSVFGIACTIMEGDEVLRFVEPDYMIPFATVSEQMRQRSLSEAT